MMFIFNLLSYIQHLTWRYGTSLTSCFRFNNMNGLRRRLGHSPIHPPPRHSQYGLCSKQRRLLTVMSLFCLLSLVQDEFRTYMESQAYLYTTTTNDLLKNLLNEGVARNESIHQNFTTNNSTVSRGNTSISEPMMAMMLNDIDDASNFSLEPMWNCTDDGGGPTTTFGRRKKLLFVHVFKTAGSTMRAFLEGYGRACHNTGVSIVSQCSGLNEVPVAKADDNDESSSSLSIWTNRGGRECVLQTFQPRRRDPLWMHDGDNEDDETQQQQRQHHPLGEPRLSRSFLRATTDVLIGHFPLGVHEHWLGSNTISNNNNSTNMSMTEKEEDFSYQYVVYFRDPLQKLVSGYLYDNRMRHNLTTEQATRELHDRVWHKQNVQNRYQDGYSSYLLTPRQKREIGKRHQGGIKNTTASTIQHNMALIKSNLLEMNVMIGIVEQMTSSLALLRHLIDGRGQLNAAWGALDTSTTSNTHVNATATLSTDLHHSTLSELSSMSTAEQLQQKPKPIALNKSRLSTTEIARLLLERDRALLTQHLRYEQDLYDFAKQIHAHQYHATIMGHAKS
jgi:hypothetical protein